jgi:hypothetical protein
MPSLHPRSLGSVIFLSLTAPLVVVSPQADGVKHTKDGTSLMAYHAAFQKQPAHVFDFHYLKDMGGVTVRGSWKSLTDHDGDQLSSAQNSYITCTKSEMSCIEATARQEGLYPRAELTFYTVTRWTDQSLEAVDDSPICVKNTLTIEFNTARVIVADVVRQDTEETVKTCANFGVRRTTTYQLW